MMFDSIYKGFITEIIPSLKFSLYTYILY